MGSSRRLAVSVVCAFFFLSAAAPAGAALLPLRAYLNGAQVPTASAQTGVATMTLDTSTRLLSWTLSFTGTTGGFQLAHFHGPAAPGGSASPVLDISTTPGTASPIVGSATLTPTQVAEVLAGQWYINIHTGSFPNGEIRGQVRRVHGDFDGDGKADLLWRHETAGTVLGWRMNGTAIASSASPATVTDAGWQLAGRGDFDGDGKTDLLWIHTDGSVYIWLMNGNSITGAGSPGGIGANSGWVVLGIGDFDGDGKADVLWKNDILPGNEGIVYAWLMNGTSVASAVAVTGVPDTDWRVQGVGDFDGDGKADVFWVHAQTGATYVWLMNGAAIANAASPAGLGPNSGWEVRGVGDFDGDGRADVLFKHTTSGTVLVWQMNGTALAGSGSPGTVGDEKAGWHILGVGDYDGDGRADIFWRNIASGNTVIWLMNGTAIGSTGTPVNIADLLWTTQGPGANRWAGLVGAQNAANIFAQTINVNGANLAASHITPLLSSGYLHDGFNGTQDAGITASDQRGVTINSLSVDRLIRFDTVNQAAFVTATITGTAPGPTPFTDTASEDKGGLGFRRQSNGTWKMHGNQRPGEMGVQTEMRTDSFPNFNSGPRQHVNVDVRTLQNQFTAVTISGGGLFNNTSIPKAGATDVTTVQADPSPASPLTYFRDVWFTGADSALTGVTTFTLTLTPASGPAVTRKVPSNVVTTQAVTVTSPTLHTLAAANLGNPLTVHWTLPAFAISQVQLGGYVSTSVSPSPGFQCSLDGVKLGTAATSGQITLPNICNGQPILEAAVNVSVDGAGGERTIHIYGFQ